MVILKCHQMGNGVERRIFMTNDILKFRGMIYSNFKNESEMAKNIGWTRQRLNKISTGKKIPNIHEINVLAKALGTDVHTIMQFFLH